MSFLNAPKNFIIIIIIIIITIIAIIMIIIMIIIIIIIIIIHCLSEQFPPGNLSSHPRASYFFQLMVSPEMLPSYVARHDAFFRGFLLAARRRSRSE